MDDQDKTREQLLEEVAELRRRLAATEGVEAERQRAVAALRESEERYRTLAEFSPDIIYILARNGNLLYANRTAAACIGISTTDLPGKTQIDLFPPEQARYHMERIREVIETGEMSEQEDLYHFGPREVWLNVRSIPVRNEQGLVTSVMGVCRDVTARKRAEEALKKAHDDLERRVAERTAELAQANDDLDIFRKFAEASGEGFAMSDFDGRIVYVNPALCRLFGAGKPEDVIGKNVSDFNSAEYMQKRGEEIIPALLRAGYWHDESAFLPLHGKPIHTSQSTFLIRDENGEPLRIAIVISDITERKLAEEALRASAERLDRQRQTLKHMLKASDHERRLIAYDIHDGMAQELAGAIMHFEMYAHAREANPQDAGSVFNSAVTMLRKSHVEARRLISGVRPPILDESGIVAAISHLVYDPAFERGPKIGFRSRVSFRRLAPVMENVIYRIVQEGLSNARNHSRSKKIEVRLVQRGDRLRIQIRDWGVGFDPAAVPKNRFGLAGIRERARLLRGSWGPITSTSRTNNGPARSLPSTARAGLRSSARLASSYRCWAFRSLRWPNLWWISYQRTERGRQSRRYSIAEATMQMRPGNWSRMAFKFGEILLPVSESRPHLSRRLGRCRKSCLTRAFSLPPRAGSCDSLGTTYSRNRVPQPALCWGVSQAVRSNGRTRMESH